MNDFNFAMLIKFLRSMNIFSTYRHVFIIKKCGKANFVVSRIHNTNLIFPNINQTCDVPVTRNVTVKINFQQKVFHIKVIVNLKRLFAL